MPTLLVTTIAKVLTPTPSLAVALLQLASLAYQHQLLLGLVSVLVWEELVSYPTYFETKYSQTVFLGALGAMMLMESGQCRETQCRVSV